MNEKVLNERLMNLRNCLVGRFTRSIEDVISLDLEFEKRFPGYAEVMNKKQLLERLDEELDEIDKLTTAVGSTDELMHVMDEIHEKCKGIKKLTEEFGKDEY